MKYIGAHVSASGGVQKAPLNAVAIGAKAFALFTKNQRRWDSAPLVDCNIKAFKKNLAESGIQAKHVLPHDGYLINLGNPDNEKRDKSLRAFLDEAKRVEQLGLTMLNFHPGSHLKQISEEACMRRIAEAMDITSSEFGSVKLVIENTAGQGSNLGYTFEQLAQMIELSKKPENVGICLDTCHTFAAGYELRTREGFENTFEQFEKIIGFDKLCGMHINDAKSAFASKVDRHANLGEGNIGWEPFQWLMEDPRFDDIPLILETSNSELWPEEIKKLYSFCKK